MASKPKPLPTPRSGGAEELGMPPAPAGAQGQTIDLPPVSEGMRQGEREADGATPPSPE